MAPSSLLTHAACWRQPSPVLLPPLRCEGSGYGGRWLSHSHEFANCTGPLHMLFPSFPASLLPFSWSQLPSPLFQEVFPECPQPGSDAHSGLLHVLGSLIPALLTLDHHSLKTSLSPLLDSETREGKAGLSWSLLCPKYQPAQGQAQKCSGNVH